MSKQKHSKALEIVRCRKTLWLVSCKPSLILDPVSIKSGNDPDCNFGIRNLGLDPDPDWIRIQQQAVSGSCLSKIPGSGSDSVDPKY
jgi:hypothetical protein